MSVKLCEVEFGTSFEYESLWIRNPALTGNFYCPVCISALALVRELSTRTVCEYTSGGPQ
jgi:hypothetical protein